MHGMAVFVMYDDVDQNLAGARVQHDLLRDKRRSANGEQAEGDDPAHDNLF